MLTPRYLATKESSSVSSESPILYFLP